MNFLKKLFGFLKSLFDRARPGLERFLEDHIDDAKRILAGYVDRKLHDIKPEVYAMLVNTLPEGTPGTWVSLLVDFAWEHLKRDNAV